MNITTKYNVGDKVWAIHKNASKELEIKTIVIMTTNDEVCIYCEVLIEGKTHTFNQCDLFRTKEDLRKAVFGE